MNLYLLIAIALGAITGVTQAPMIRPSVILSREDGEGSQVAKFEILRCAQNDAYSRSPVVRTLARPLFVHLESPLTGAATPRAPAPIR